MDKKTYVVMMKNYGQSVYHDENELQKFTQQDLLILNCGFYSSSNSPFLHNSYEEHALLLYISKGHATIKYKSKEFFLTQGSIFIFPPKLKHHIYYHGDPENERYFIFFNGTKIESTLKSLNLSYGLYHIDFFGEFVDITKKLFTDFELNHTNNMFYKNILFLTLLSKIHESINKRENTSAHFKTVFPAITHMQENFKDHMLSIDEYANMCYVSKSTFQRIFKKYKNTSPTKYFMTLKIENAKMQLTNSNKTISEIAFDLSFIDPLYFSKVFKSITGKSPSLFKKQYFNV